MSARYSLLLFLLRFVSNINTAKGTCGYSTCHPIDENKLNVHLVPHTHDDVGWLKTVDQYYYGSKKNLARMGVQYILDTVMPELERDPNRRFIYVETAFFWRWWEEQDQITKDLVQKLVQSGRLEFINGGWSMNDEAATHYNAIIDQMTWGFRRLNDTFGECGRPRVAWHIDPFGHSKEQANLFANMGFDGFFFGRLDYEDRANRKKTKTMEMVWKASKDTTNKLAWLFTGALESGYYPPSGFCFDSECNDDPIMDDQRLHDYNVEEKVDQFVKALRDQASHYATNNIMLTMGGDFQYTNAKTWFKNLEKLIYYVNQKPEFAKEFNLIYSTPSCYLKAIHEKNRNWTSKYDDFFPYGSDGHSYWTGYFTSRPALKGMVRDGNNYLQVCKQMNTFTKLLNNQDYSDLTTMMREAMGVLQHHDAVTGTAKQAVTFDYAERLDRGFQACSFVIEMAYASLSKLDQSKSTAPPLFEHCPLLNITQCHATENKKSFVVNIYNPLDRPITKHINIPVSQALNYKVYDNNGMSNKIQIIPIPKEVLDIPGRESTAKYELYFKAVDLPPMGYRSYYITTDKGPSGLKKNHKDSMGRVYKPKLLDENYKIFGDDNMKIQLNKYGTIEKIYMANGEAINLNQSVGWYEGYPGNVGGRASGAYIFRPYYQHPNMFGNPNISVEEITGPLVDEYRIVINSWISYTLRYHKDLPIPSLELDYIVGPIPIQDQKGKEIIIRYSSELKNDGIFYTDSNGRQMLERKINYRPTWNYTVSEPVSGNYYPVNSRIAINNGNIQITVLNDRSQGGSSINDGQIELMVHRRLLYDDGMGVGEPLNEKAFGKGLVIRGKHKILVNPEKTAAKNHRFLAQEMFMDVSLSIADPGNMNFDQWKKSFSMEKSFIISGILPSNVHILTLENWRNDEILVRFEHIFDIGEHPHLSEPVSFNIENLFGSRYQIKSLKELTLGANLELDKLKRFQWNTQNEIESINDIISITSSTIKLDPMQIRTFIIKLSS